MEEKRDGIHFDQMPGVLKPFRRQIFSSTGQAVMNRFGVPKTLGEDNRKLVAGSPLLLAVLLDGTEYRPASSRASVFGMGAAVENVWLTTAAIGMGIQFVSTPMEIPENWQKLLAPEGADDLELMAVYRLGYVPRSSAAPPSTGRAASASVSQHVFRNTCEQPEPVSRETGRLRVERAPSQDLGRDRLPPHRVGQRRSGSRGACSPRRTGTSSA